MLDAYRASLSPDRPGGYDELVSADGTPRPGWEELELQAWDVDALRAARSRAARLLEDDGVTYHPVPGGDRSRAASQWRLDPLPAVVGGDDWAAVERGVAQRARLLEAVLADLYGPRRLLTSGLVPAELVWRHGGYVRPAWGPVAHDRPRLALAAADLGRGPDGQWCVIGDRTQAPVGLGYAMENRRVLARLHPDAYRRVELRRLTAFYSEARDSLAELAAPGVDDPRVVVLTPSRPGDTDFDQAHIASLLGFPLVTGDDLVMRDGRVWTRDLGGHRPVDVVVRRVDDTWCDPLELRPDSELGVPGLLEAWRRGTVALANGVGVGLAESPGLHPFLPRLCEVLLDEPLLLPSAPAWWCGDPDGLAYVLDHLDSLVLRPLASNAGGRGVHLAGVSRQVRDRWRERVARRPADFVGQQVLPLSTAPTVSGFGVGPRPWTVRAFAVAGPSGYAVMPGALGLVASESVDPATGRRERLALSKDVWVLSRPEPAGLPEPALTLARRPAEVPMVPRALQNLFWMGRWVERVEDVTRHVLVLRGLLDEFPHGRGAAAWSEPGRRAVLVVARALALATEAVPTLAETEEPGPGAIDAALRELFVETSRVGSVGHAVESLAGAAAAVRDQLSHDVFSVLGGMERACDAADESPVLQTGLDVLHGALALAGIAADNMVRDVGWQMLVLGRAVERALQTLDLVQWVVGEVQPPMVERHLVRAALTAGESVVTHRRRYAGRHSVASMLDLMLLDEDNPRAVAFQLRRVRSALERVPGEAAARLADLVDEAELDVRARDATGLAEPRPRLTDTDELFTEQRSEVVELAGRMRTRLQALADGLADAYFSHPATPRALGSVMSFDPRALAGRGGAGEDGDEMEEVAG